MESVSAWQPLPRRANQRGANGAMLHLEFFSRHTMVANPAYHVWTGAGTLPCVLSHRGTSFDTLSTVASAGCQLASAVTAA